MKTDKTLFDTYDFNNSILILSQLDTKKLFFYTKTGERLWVYEEEEVVDEMSCARITFCARSAFQTS